MGPGLRAIRWDVARGVARATVVTRKRKEARSGVESNDRQDGRRGAGEGEERKMGLLKQERAAVELEQTQTESG